MINFTCDFDKWNIRFDRCGSRVQQFDNLTIPLIFTGVFPDDYDSWHVYLKCGNNLDILELQPVDNGYSVLLTANQLSFRGTYDVQLFGKSGDLVRHSNIASFVNPYSISGDKQWPELPTPFTEALNKAESFASHSPIINSETLTWLLWDYEESRYYDSGMPAVGSVNSVNGQRGDVILEIPSKTSDLENDSGFLTEHQSLDSKQDKIEAVGVLMHTSDDRIIAAIPGVDYIVSHQNISHLQNKTLVDAGGYFEVKTVEAALQQIGSELSGVNSALDDLLTLMGEDGNDNL